MSLKVIKVWESELSILIVDFSMLMFLISNWIRGWFCIKKKIVFFIDWIKLVYEFFNYKFCVLGLL